MAIQKARTQVTSNNYTARNRYKVGDVVLKNGKVYQNITGISSDPELFPNDWVLLKGVNVTQDEYILPNYYIHNWTQVGQHTFNLCDPTNAGNSSVRMESLGLGDSHYIIFYFKEPILISEIHYVNSSIIASGNAVKQFKLFGSTDIKDSSYPLTLHDSTIGDAEMENISPTNLDFFEPYKKITLANPQTVASLRFTPQTVWDAGTRARIQKILFK